MSDLLNNKTQLQKLLATLSRKKANGTVTSVNGKSGDVVTEMADLGVTVETWTFELEDGTTVDKDMVFYTVSLITFTIDDISYQAEEGMTWEEWCDSEYNTDGYHLDSLGIFVLDSSEVWMISNVSSSEIITDGTTYMTETAGGGWG